MRCAECGVKLIIRLFTPLICLFPSRQNRFHERGKNTQNFTVHLAGLDAAVPSVDISEEQLARTQSRTEVLNLDITFQCADMTDPSSLIP